ncbi:MAG: hypothetical protein ACFCU5_20015 [Pleurocapsa sp.]
MKKLTRFSAFFTMVIASGLLNLSTTAASVRQEKSSDINYEIASISNFGDPNNNSTNDLNKIIGITGLAAGTAVIAYQLLRRNKSASSNFWHDRNNDALLLDRVSPKLRQKLLRLVHNKQTANRLLMGTMFSHSHRSPNWLADKVIYDLERDRKV